ncbi:Bug family tripartite tricarboxylate transporter substrate binding protein [Hydrogenophaga sp. BPS33]|uniref:Bug family tripartite tricarboxylate transporter substrate binding protein n=1 Tax=Hydrogenophaga sp. BPS33 TaxID=2651974 RepID=UPI00131F4CD1|nr:tripartite tricarboxylate transporter substrate binding protein [Hydrogenophaga sp. BPS33]QHE84506.1 tripartite tricarboxylate transporter substrate binding protein [Hydrogenophaga sp. BPS33]
MITNLKKQLVRAGLVFACALGVLSASAQTYPSRPITLVVPYSAGGTVDTLARAAAEGLAARLGQGVVVENRPGGNAIVAARFVANAEPNGYTLLFVGGSVLSKVFQKDPPINMATDFVPIAPLYQGPFVLAVGAKVPARTLAEFISYAKANPGVLNYGSAAPNAMMSMEALKAAAGIDVKHIPYKGGANVTTALLSNEVQAAFEGITSFRAHAASGAMKILAVGANRRLEEIPDVPTIAESGYPGFLTVFSGGLWAPAKTPAAVVQRLNHELLAVAKSPAFVDRVRLAGAAPVAGTPEELPAMVRAEVSFWTEAARRAGYVPE